MGYAHDTGQFPNADPSTRAWFNGLKSGKGPCCSFADGVSLTNVDWEWREDSYWVRIDGTWLRVPNDAVLAGPNRVGVAVVWPFTTTNGETLIRCFIPGTMT